MIIKIKQNCKTIISSFNFFLCLFFRCILIKKNSLKKNNYFVCAEGGFGHTICNPQFLNCKFGDDWIMFYGYKQGRHNKKITKFFDNLFFIPIGNLNIEHNTHIAFKISNFLSNLFFKKNIISFKDFIEEQKPKLPNCNDYFKTNESVFASVVTANKRIFYKKEKLFRSFHNTINFVSGKFDKKIAFGFRYKGKNSNDFSNLIRDSRKFKEQIFLIKELVNLNYQIFLYGDLGNEDLKWTNDYGNSIITRDKLEISKDDYHVFIGFYPDIYIGQASGLLSYVYLERKKTLLLECNQIGYGYPESIVSYPKKKFNSKKEFQDFIIKGYSFDKQIYDDLNSLTNQELMLILKGFLKNLDNKDYGVEPEKLGINKGILIDSKSKFSNEWLQINNIY